ncbi:MAG: 16S rRNA (adenine(1518)-N(6)/adenine(1519)-N(6))-dimethyltransferase RsmA [Thermodesulfobacteriota bacterium]
MPSILKELRAWKVVPKRRWGQHFLIDRNILNKIVRSAKIGKEDIVLEIGPGLGEMTLLLAEQAERVFAIEIDSYLVRFLRKKLEGISNIEVIEGDILEFDFSSLFRRAGRPLRVVANLPYQISSPLLFRFVEERKFFYDLHLMMQKEVVERLIALPGRKVYGSLSVLIQAVAIPTLLFLIKPSAFFPPPKVDSAFVRIEWRRKALVERKGEEWFKKVVKDCFGYRRKTLLNALKFSDLPLPENLEERLRKEGIDKNRRPETFTPQEFVKLSELIRN